MEMARHVCLQAHVRNPAGEQQEVGQGPEQEQGAAVRAQGRSRADHQPQQAIEHQHSQGQVLGPQGQGGVQRRPAAQTYPLLIEYSKASSSTGFPESK